MLRLFMDLDFGYEPYLWAFGAEDPEDPVPGSAVLVPWVVPPITPELPADLKAWGETWEKENYYNDDKWTSKAAYQARAERGRLLWARATR
jgi:hypothetical protein